MTIEVPGWLYRVCVWVVLLWRRRWYGYSFWRIPLTRGQYAIVDVEDYGRVAKYKWHAAKGPRTWYAVRSLTNGKKEKRKNSHMHHAILKLPTGVFIDHINHNGLDNRKANLRLATHTQNIWHRRKFRVNSRSKYKGVDWVEKQKAWRARIRVNGKRIYLGSFKNEIEAARGYDAAARKFHGQFAALNFPDGR